MCLRGADMDYPSETYRFQWQGITIEATYTPRMFNAIAHLQIRSIAPDRAPLPISPEGWRSYYHPMGTIEAHGGDVVAQVTAWLDEEATKPEWKALAESSRQGKLF
jgi:hypothetical protein